MREKIAAQPGYFDREPRICVECNKPFTVYTPKGVVAMSYQQDPESAVQFLSLEKIREIEKENKKDQYCLDCWKKLQSKKEKRDKK